MFSPATREVLRQINLIEAKIIDCDCAMMHGSNTNQKDREALLQQCLTDLERKIMDLEAEPEERESLVKNWAKFHEIREDAEMLSGIMYGRCTKDMRESNQTRGENGELLRPRSGIYNSKT